MNTHDEFIKTITDAQVKWRKDNLTNQTWGMWTNGKTYPHLLPKELWTEGLWEGIKADLTGYLAQNKIQAHAMKHSLRSSWILNANLYYPIRISPVFRQLFIDFLNQRIALGITQIEEVEMEFAFPIENELNPYPLLGEKEGTRGAGQTSPDIAFFVKSSNGNGILLTECKYTENTFYRCSARSKEDQGDKPGNPDPGRCLQRPDLFNFRDINNCQQTAWGRQYWKILNLSQTGLDSLICCPAAKNGYQLFRQQALAEGIAHSGRFEFAISSVAYDKNNVSLQRCLGTSGIQDWTTDWGKQFRGRALFHTWTHQEWVQYVRLNQSTETTPWLSYIQTRYQY